MVVSKVSEEQFQKNVHKWALGSPKEASLVLKMKCGQTAFTNSSSDELSLVKEENGETIHLYSKEGPSKEAADWFSKLDLYGIHTLFVYGVGLGYHYLAAKNWLEEDETRVIIFLEDDLEAIHCLLKTDAGTELIQDQQAWLQYCPKIKKDEDWELFQKSLEQIPIKLFMRGVLLSGLNHYIQKDPIYFGRLMVEMDFVENVKIFQEMEHLRYGEGFFKNYYRNLFELPDSYLMKEMISKFKGLPAIICGAGPSLKKNLHVLEKLSDRALIFAGGTAMNTVSYDGFLPHFGVCVDPNMTQYNRLFMNQAFQVPYFYRSRVYHEALEIIHGDHIYTSGASGYNIAEWVEKQLDIEGGNVDAGHNVINLSLSIAQALGCSPIILVGVDLAYTGDESYAEGVFPHPIHDVSEKLTTRRESEEVIVRNDIEGNPVCTLWKWVMESVWYTQTAITNPRTRIINATEGGLGFEGIPNMTLAEVKEKYLDHQFDISGYVHGEIQNSPMPERVSNDKVEATLEKLESSLLKSRQLCKDLRKEFSKIHKQVKTTGESPPNLVTDKALEDIRELNNEVAFEAVLKTFNESFLSYYGKKDLDALYSYEGEIDQAEIDRKRSMLHKRRYEFLKAVIDTNLEVIKGAVTAEKIKTLITDALSKDTAKIERVVSETAKDKYAVEGERFTIHDVEMGVDFDEPLSASLIDLQVDTEEESEILKIISLNSDDLNGKCELHYSTGEKKMETHYLNGKLHGPSIFYGKNGNILAQSWFVKGKRQGKTYYYYPSGEIHSLHRFRDDLLDGKQEYYFSDGRLKSLLSYKMGKLDGEQTLYYQSGEIKKTGSI